MRAIFRAVADAKVVFGTCWDALGEALGPSLDEPFRQELRSLGVDLSRLNAAYPYELWLRSIELAMERLWPGVDRDEATYRMGRAMYERFGQTIVGRALMQVLAVLGPRRSLERMERNFRTANNYSHTRLIQLESNHYELSVSDVHFPHYYRGILTAGLERSTRSASVKVIAHQPDGDATFDIRWD